MPKKQAATTSAPQTTKVVVQMAPKKKKKRNRRRGAAGNGSGGIKRMRSTGSDLVATQNLPSGASPGVVIFNHPLNPAMMPGSRLASEAKLYARWRPVNLRVRFVGSGGTTSFGTVTLAWCADPSIHLKPGTSLQRVLSMRPSKTMRMYESGAFSIPTETARKWYYTDGPLDDASHGVLLGIVSARTGGYAATCTANIFLDWTVEFEGVDMPDDSGIVRLIRPDAGHSNLFTTSDGSWNAERLTFKDKSGGDMIPFTEAQAGVVYTTAEGTKVMYVNESKSTVQCKYFSLVVGYSTPGLVLHATWQDASDYQQSGDLAKVLKYITASTYATPAIPVFAEAKKDNVQSLLTRIEELEGMISALRTPTSPLSDFDVRDFPLTLPAARPP